MFAYNVVGDVAPLPERELFEFRDELYGFVGIRMRHYAMHARTISPRWDTLAVPTDRFRELAAPVAHFFSSNSAAGRSDPSRGATDDQSLPLEEFDSCVR